MKPDNPGNTNRLPADPLATDFNRRADPQGFRQICHEIDIRVRYQETDAQGHVHHATYLNYFEMGRVELLRAAGHSYRDLEDQGMMLVVTEVGCQYLAPARYDDVLRLSTTVVRSRGARIRHEYEIRHGDDLVVRGFTVVAAVDRSGKILRIPKWLQIPRN